MPGKTNAAFRMIVAVYCLCCLSAAAWGATGPHPLIAELERSSGTKLHHTYHKATGNVRFLWSEAGQPIARTRSGAIGPEAAARSFLDTYGAMFGIDTQGRDLRLKRHKVREKGRSFLRFQQLQSGLPVIGGELVVQLDADNGIRSVNAKISPNSPLDVIPAISAAEAMTSALRHVGRLHNVDPAVLTASEPELSVYNPVLLDHKKLSASRLVWRLEVTAKDLSPIREFVLVDAKRGLLALHFNQVYDAINRSIYDNSNDASIPLPGTNPVRTEGSAASGNSEVDHAYDYLGDTYNFYLTTHGRDSLDGAGMKLIGTVRYRDPAHPGSPLQNAFWNGTQMVFGDGFAQADDVVAHELTHAVTQMESGLFYYMQSGAINEAFSDIWGEFVDLTNGRGTDTDAVRWKMGEDLPASIGIVRDMKNPPLFNQPDRMGSTNYYCGTDDEGGVHTNSGIANKAAYLMTDGDTFNGRTVTGIGITKVAKIFYEVQTNLLTSGGDYGDLYDALNLACTNLTGMSGITATDCQQVKNALDAVEMNLQPANCPTPEAALCPAGGGPADLFYDNFENGDANWIPAAITGSNAWSLDSGYATSGSTYLYGADNDSTSDSYMKMKTAVALPAKAYLHFNHAFEFDSGSSSAYDGGVIEYSTDDGSTWTDAGSLIAANGYNATLNSNFQNPLGGRQAFGKLSYGYLSSRLDLDPLTGQNVQFRFRIGTDSSYGANGWVIDDVRLYTCQLANDVTPPTVSFTTPGDGATDVAAASTVKAVFSEAMDPTTITTATFAVKDALNSPVAGTVSYDAATFTATFTPSASLAFQSTYTATISAGAKDMAGHGLAAQKSWTFTTGVTVVVLSEGFNMAGTPSGWTVTDNAGTGAVWTFNNAGKANDTGGSGNYAIADSSPFIATPMNTELRTPALDLAGFSRVTLQFKTFFRSWSDEIADVDVSVNGATGPWTNVWHKSGADYTGAESIDISALASGKTGVIIRFHYNANYDWYWEVDDVVVKGTNDVPPTVISTSPAGGASGVAIGTAVKATFSKAMNVATISGATFVLKDNLNNPVAGTVTYNAPTMTATFAPTVNLAGLATYSASISTAVRDTFGNAMSGAKTWSFTTSGQKKNLAVTMAGTGSGNVNSVPSGIACTTGNCTGQFDLNQQVTLAAAASAGSLFSGWSDPGGTGSCSNTTGDCLVTMNADKTVSATFDVVPKVHVMGGTGYYGTIQSAYNSAVNTDTIAVQGTDLTENLSLDRSIAVTLTGGYDANFVTRTSITALHGSLIVKNGTLHISGIVIK